jgi:hypothetical protein
MANEEQLGILRQGAKVWNKWLEKNPKTIIDLNQADLSGSDLSGANLSKAYLDGANLVGANLNSANLYGTYLFGANLNRANLSGTNLNIVELSGANLNSANLFGAHLSKVFLIGTDFSEAILWETNFVEIDLSQANKLETIIHRGPSHISTDILRLSKGEIPEVFLRGCGFSDWEIETAKLYKPGLSNQEINNIIYKIFDLRANQSIQISPLFISYSHADTPFVEKLESSLTKKGIRFWRDIHDATAGRLEKQIDHAMRQNSTVILILSESSTHSDWVEHEARLARELEKELGRDVLCPIALDASWKFAKWPARLMEQIMEYNILDYSNWQNDKSFGQVFNKMLSGLDMFYKQKKSSRR